jgi:hypothetical protein
VTEQAHHRSDLQPLCRAVRQPEHIVEEPVFVVPHAGASAGVRHRGRDPEEVLDELARHVEVGRPMLRQLDGDLGHVLAEERHPRRAIRLIEVPAGRQR